MGRYDGFRFLGFLTHFKIVMQTVRTRLCVASLKTFHPGFTCGRGQPRHPFPSLPKKVSLLEPSLLASVSLEVALAVVHSEYVQSSRLGPYSQGSRFDYTPPYYAHTYSSSPIWDKHLGVNLKSFPYPDDYLNLFYSTGVAPSSDRV